mmetsp:Transcript_27788/g.58406  ORF Transcript_27788/g.58406 Transcript_27788/m.58406 type:complete len:597 (+) Transcript_27788:228-2018(+)|eukprot:CAMPEP_0171348706 /NCGR_PEP_ID=MMETSP0878-20121228/31661_1 /TAXON_ID=67004 /ORGANISM="Thalassiosira weissflogii, Strain CCMP1336" /LENGTH=596 /DNA_ID=CAMNT_0011853143 /DNA_START=73 /DNA_END=1863 /DNA_ORIENTATION=-
MALIKSFWMIVLSSAYCAASYDEFRDNKIDSNSNKNLRLLKKKDDLWKEPTQSPTTMNPTTPNPSISPTTLSQFCSDDKRKDHKICREWFAMNESQYPSQASSKVPSRDPSGAPSLYLSESPGNFPSKNESSLPTAYPTHVVTNTSTETEYMETVNDSSSDNASIAVVFVPIGYFEMCLTIRSRIKRLLFTTRQHMNENASYEPRELELAATRRHLYATYKEAFQEAVVSLELHFVPGGDSDVSGNVMRNSTFYGSVGFLVPDGEDGPSYTEVESVTKSAFEGAKKDLFLQEFHGFLYGDFDSVKASSLYDVSISASTKPEEIDLIKPASTVQSTVTPQSQGEFAGFEKESNSPPTLIAGAIVGGLVFVVILFGFAVFVKNKHRERNWPMLREIAQETNNFNFHSERTRSNSTQQPRSLLCPFNKEKSNFEEVLDDASIVSDSIASSTIESMEQRTRECQSMDFHPIQNERTFSELQQDHYLDPVEENNEVEVVSCIDDISPSESTRNESEARIYNGPRAGNDFLSVGSESDGSCTYNENNLRIRRNSKKYDYGVASNYVEQENPDDMPYDGRGASFWNGEGETIVREIKELLSQR